VASRPSHDRCAGVLLGLVAGDSPPAGWYADREGSHPIGGGTRGRSAFATWRSTVRYGLARGTPCLRPLSTASLSIVRESEGGRGVSRPPPPETLVLGAGLRLGRQFASPARTLADLGQTGRLAAIHPRDSTPVDTYRTSCQLTGSR